MLHLLKQLKLYTTLGDSNSVKETRKYLHQNLLMITYRLPAPVKLFLQLKHNTDLLIHL